jgi:signal transduction histidine kinase
VQMHQSETTEVAGLGVVSAAVGQFGPQEQGALGPADALRLVERERSRIGLELHDGLTQDVAAARMRLESLLSSEKVPAGPVRASLSDVLDLLRRAEGEARRVILGLSSPTLDEVGLAGAISQLTADQPNGGPKIEVISGMPSARLDPRLENTVYRIVQEAVTNIRRHSRADRAEVRLNLLSDRFQIVVQDWGVGFDPARVEGQRFGLKGIRERARLLGGRAQVDSGPGKGTRIVVDLPLVDLSRETSVKKDRSLS